MEKSKLKRITIISGIVYFLFFFLIFFLKTDFSVTKFNNVGGDLEYKYFVYSPETFAEFINKTALPDLRLTYNVKELHDYIFLLNNEQFEDYKKFLKLDFIYAFCYGLFFSSIISILYMRKHPKRSGFFLSMIPFLATIVDYFENIGILNYLGNESISFLTYNLGYLTLIKHIFLILSFIVIIYLLLNNLRTRKIK